MTEDQTRKARDIITALSGALTLAAPALPAPGPGIARLVAAGLGAAAAMIDQGASLDEAVHRIQRVRRIDTTEVDADARRRADALPSSANPPSGEPNHPED